jgi:hypothetical protein
MVELQTPQMNTVFHALGDATRRHMLRDLAGGEREVRGRTHLCRLDPGPLASAHEWLSFYERFWTSRLDVLEQLLRDEDDASKSRKPTSRKPAPKSKSRKGDE